MNENEFNLDFDFEKEYGIDLSKDDAELQIDEDFDLDAILAEEFGDDFTQFEGEYAADFDYGPEPEAEPEVKPEEIPEPESFDDLFLDEAPAEEYPEELEPVSEEVPLIPVLVDKVKTIAGNIAAKIQAAAKQKASEPRERPQREPAADGRRRKPMSPMRKFKNETLPLIILGVAAVLILIFVCGSISRGITNAQLNKEAEQKASEAAQSAALQEAAAAQSLLKDAAALAAGYDYQGAVDLLNTFTGSSSKYPEIDQAKADYTMALSQLVEYTDVSAITNLSFHVLIADPARAFADAKYSSSYQKNFVTINEFQSILEELYSNNYILVDMDDFVTETTVDGATSYEFTPLYLPEGKTPIMITETYGYHLFMVDSDGDGEADKNGGGFASRLVVDGSGEIKAEMVDAEGNTTVGNYALVPILESFIDAHPDFSYRGARATIAITGYDGIFGYRTNADVATSKGQEYYNQQVDGATEVANALREHGYTIACYTYANKDYGSSSADQIQSDLNSWKQEVASIIGSVDTLVYAKESDISSTGDYTNSKFTVLHNEGFRYFISSGTKTTTEAASGYVRQVRLMVTGTQMVNAASVYTGFFDAASVLDAARSTN